MELKFMKAILKNTKVDSMSNTNVRWEIGVDETKNDFKIAY